MVREALVHRHVAVASCTLVLAAVAACGGGSSTSSSEGGSQPPATVITVSNADAVAARGYETASALTDVTDVAASSLKSDTRGASGFSPTRFALDRLRDAIEGRLSDGLATKGVVPKGTTTLSQPCPSGGSVTLTADDVNGNGDLDAGDSLSFAFSACVADGVTAEGGMAMTLTALSTAGATSSGQAAVVFNGLRVTEGGSTSSVNGDMTLAAVYTTSAPFTTDVAVAGSRLAVTEGSEARTLTAYSSRALFDDTNQRFTYTLSGNVSGSGLPGTLALSTPTPIAGAYGGPPAAGVLRMGGADGSSVTLTASPPAGVVLAVDANGDGTVESQRTLTWAQLDAL